MTMSFMKKILIIVSSIVIFSCTKKEVQHNNIKTDSAKIIESINVVRMKINDSIQLKNNRNIFKDLNGNHSLKFSSDETTITGKVNFEKKGRDLYTVSGGGKSGKNTVTIEGIINQVSPKHLNFQGKIIQNINGKTYTRTKKTTFLDEGKGNFWRLQDKINGSGFVEYIDIHF